MFLLCAISSTYMTIMHFAIRCAENDFFSRNLTENHIEKMWTQKIKTVKKNQFPRSISHSGASLLKFSGRNSIREKNEKLLFYQVRMH